MLFVWQTRTIKCKDCGNDFIFTEAEQAFYKEKGFDNEPVRCPDCRKARKAQRNNGGYGENRTVQTVTKNKKADSYESAF